MAGTGIFMLLSLLPMMAALALVVWAVVTIVQAVTLPRGAVREPVCERCKYAVAGVAGFQCPECGGDLRKLGIITPAMEASRRGSLTGAILAWTFLCLVVGYLVFTVSFMVIGVGAAWGAGGGGATSTWTQTLTPNRPVYNSVDLEYESDWQALSDDMEIVLTLSDGTQASLVLDPGPMTVVGLDSGPQAWDASVVDAWFAQSGLDLTDPNVAGAAQEVARVVDLTVMAPTSGYSLVLAQHTNMLVPTGMAPQQATSGFDQMIMVALAGLGTLVVVYVLGICGMVWRRRRMFRVVLGETT